MDVNYVIPTGTETCDVVFDWYLDTSAYSQTEECQEMIRRNIKDSEQVSIKQEETDVRIEMPRNYLVGRIQ